MKNIPRYPCNSRIQGLNYSFQLIGVLSSMKQNYAAIYIYIYFVKISRVFRVKEARFAVSIQRKRTVPVKCRFKLARISLNFVSTFLNPRSLAFVPVFFVLHHSSSPFQRFPHLNRIPGFEKYLKPVFRNRV